MRRRSISGNDDILNIDNLSGTTLRDAIYNERRLEFLGEAISSLDFHRRGTTIVKQAGTAGEFSTAPGADGYIFPIPTIERSSNHSIDE